MIDNLGDNSYYLLYIDMSAGIVQVASHDDLQCVESAGYDAGVRSASGRTPQCAQDTQTCHSMIIFLLYMYIIVVLQTYNFAIQRSHELSGPDARSAAV